MFHNILLTLLATFTLASAHFRVLSPFWRGNSFASGTSQYIYPCANVTNSSSIRTQWPLTGGSVLINGSHSSALTYVNLGLGGNVSNFNISLVDAFNQTGAGTFCLKDAIRMALANGFRASNVSMDSMDGMLASVQVVQIGHTGGALYNCADIVFNASAPLLGDDQCRNATGVGGSFIQNAGASTQSPTPSAGTPQQTGAAAAMLLPKVGSGMVAAGVAWALL